MVRGPRRFIYLPFSVHISPNAYISNGYCGTGTGGIDRLSFGIEFAKLIGLRRFRQVITVKK